MKKYIRASIKPERIEYKKNYINSVIKKIHNGSASMQEMDTACDMIYWLWKWKVIDREESGKLADLISDAMEGKYPDGSDAEYNYFEG